MKDGFIIYKSLYEPISELTTHDKGLLLEALFLYQRSGETKEDLPPLVLMAFKFFKNQFDIDQKKYEAKCLKNKDSANKRWNANASDGMQTNTNDADKDKVKEKDNDNVKDNEHYLRDSSTFQESTLRTLHIDLKEYLRHLDIFCIPNDMSREETELKRHFFNWLKQQDLISNQKKSIEPYG